MPPTRSVAPGTPVRAGAPVFRSSRTQLTWSRRETELAGNTSSSAARPSLLRNVRRVSRERLTEGRPVALRNRGDRNHAGAARVAREALAETINRIPPRVGLRDGIRWKLDDDAQRFNNAVAIHLFEGVERMDRFCRLRKPIASGETGIQSPDLPGEQKQRSACQEEGKPGMRDNHLSPSPPAISRARGPMRIQLWSKGQSAKINPRTEQRQHRRNEGIREQNTHSRHQESRDADGTDFADRNRQEREESDGYR